jgi:hypothetical protein
MLAHDDVYENLAQRLSKVRKINVHLMQRCSLQTIRMEEQRRPQSLMTHRREGREGVEGMNRRQC